MKAKLMKESQVTMVELVLPNDTNILNNLLGGRLMHWMDIAAAMAASRHSHTVAVTAEVDDLSFHEPISGSIVSLKGFGQQDFNTSMKSGESEVEDLDRRKSIPTAHISLLSA
jgi:acyl-CoA hydrolase